MIEVPRSQDRTVIADWAELSCIFSRNSSLSSAQIMRTLEDAYVIDSSTVLANIWLEIQHRQMLLSSKYPIELQEGRLVRRTSLANSLEYAFPLLISTNYFYESTSIRNKDRLYVAKLFEEYSTLAIANYLNGSAINFGSKRKKPLPKNLNKCVGYLCSVINEKKGKCNDMSPQAQDEDADIIAWIPFSDDRSSQLIILAQCTTAKETEYERKVNEPRISLWNNYIDWLVPALPAFAFPSICEDDLQWRRLSRSNNTILFDRIRLASLCSLKNGSNLRKEVKKWVQKQAQLLPNLDT